jgi:hypothetical protein
MGDMPWGRSVFRLPFGSGVDRAFRAQTKPFQPPPNVFVIKLIGQSRTFAYNRAKLVRYCPL